MVLGRNNTIFQKITDASICSLFTALLQSDILMQTLNLDIDTRNLKLSNS